jgi:1-acyl-sn-glycerol-3-phosphate acyltransferase
MVLLGAARILALGGRTLETIGRARLSRLSPAQKAEWLSETCRMVCERHGFAVEVEGRLPSGTALLVANHLSYIDPVVIGSLIPCAPLAKAELADWPVVGTGARTLGVLFVKRGDVLSGARALRAALRCLREGTSVLGFPEGTTARDRLLPFRRGLFGAARIAGVPIVPLALSYDHPAAAWVGDEWFLPHYLRTAMRPVTRAFVRVGDAIDPRCVGGGEPAALAAHTRAQIAALLRRAQ